MKILITGSARGIGAGLAVRLGAQGNEVAVHYRRSAAAAADVVDRITTGGGRGVLVSGDVTEAGDAAALVDDAINQLEGLDALINNVGGFLLKNLDELTATEWDQQIASTVSATFYVSRAALPSLRASGRGRIVNFSDSSADKIVARPRSTPYSIGKLGILVLTRSMAVTEAEHGITVNAILPGVMDNSDPLPDPAKIPAGRHGTGSDVGAVVDFLLSEDAGYLTGAFLHVGGGWNL